LPKDDGLANFLWDNDIIFKSIDWGLYEFFLEFLSNSSENNYHLAQCKYVGRKKFAKYSDSSNKIKQLETLLNKMEILPEFEEGNIVQFFKTNQLNVDTGEALLIQALQNQDGWMLTGDKKAIRAIEKIPTNDLDLSFLHGRVIIWEDLLMYIIQKYDWKKIQECVKSASNSDSMFRVVFTKNNLKNKESVIQAIQSYQKENQKEFKKFLLPVNKIKKVFTP
jgi:hypothetical protein